MKKPVPADAGGSQVLPGEERRRSQRVMIRVPVTLQVEGQKATLQGVTVSVNDHGAMLSCARAIPTGAKLELQNDRSGQKQLCRVTRAPIASQQSYLVPVEFLSLAPGFWGISFPPTDWKPADD